MSVLFRRAVLNLTLSEMKVTCKLLIKHNLNNYIRKQYCSTSVVKQKIKKPKSDKQMNEPKPRIKSNRQIVFDYMSSSDELKKALPHIPMNCVKICKTPPSHLYFVSDSTAKNFTKLVADKLNGKCPIVEINPGFGCLTKNLLDNGVQSLILFETSLHFNNSIEILQNQYPDRIDYRNNDFFGMYKLMFQDTLDRGNRFEALMQGININQESKDASIQILGAMSSTAFLKSTMYSFIFNADVLGKPELFVVVPPSAFYSLVPNELIKASLNNTLSTLFQLLFDYSVLATFPRENFLPWQVDTSKNFKKNTLRKRLLEMDVENSLLVHIKLKDRLPCELTSLSLLWFFFKQHLRNTKTRIIPSLEQWIPGCGIWLITGQDPPDTDSALSPDEHDASLPHMTIFTQFHDLNAQQKLTLFKKFISWPEFKSCPFTDEMLSYKARLLNTGSSSEIPAKYDDLFEQDNEDIDAEE